MPIIYFQVFLATLMSSLCVILVINGNYFYMIVGGICLLTIMFGLFPLKMFRLFGVHFEGAAE